MGNRVLYIYIYVRFSKKYTFTHAERLREIKPMDLDWTITYIYKSYDDYLKEKIRIFYKMASLMFEIFCHEPGSILQKVNGKRK